MIKILIRKIHRKRLESEAQILFRKRFNVVYGWLMQQAGLQAQAGNVSACSRIYNNLFASSNVSGSCFRSSLLH